LRNRDCKPLVGSTRGCLFLEAPTRKVGVFVCEGLGLSSAMRSGMALLCSFVLLAAACPWMPVAEAAQSPPALSDRIRATDKALRCLYAHQNTDGGFGDSASDPQATCETVLAFASAYEEPSSVRVGDKSPLDYLATQVVTQTNSAEGTALLVLAVVAGNEDPSDFAETDLTATLDGYYHGASGRYCGLAPEGIAAQALAIMAKQVSWESVPVISLTWLKGQQNPDGGWGAVPGQASDTESTALSIQALIAAGEPSSSQPVRDAVAYLHERHTEDAGFGSSILASASDPASTSQAIQALLAAGENLFSSNWRRCLNTPFDALLDAQQGDGCFEDDLQITATAVPALMGRSLPLPGRYLAALKALDWLRAQQANDGSFGNGGFTADAVYAIALCSQDPGGSQWQHPVTGKTPLDSLDGQTIDDYIAGAPPGGPAGELGKLIRGLQRAGQNPYDFESKDLVGELKDLYDLYSPKYHPNKIFSHDLAIIALHAVSETIPIEAVSTLESAQLDTGGWPWAWGATSADVDSTGLSMQAIVAAGGPSSPGITDDAADFLETLRFSNGGYPDLPTRREPNCDSTSLAIQGLLACGRYRQEPLLFVLETGIVASSWDALLAFQEPTGSFVASASVPESRLLATVEAIHALASPLYPAYQPLTEGDATVAGTAHGRVTCGNGLEVVAPYSGDDNNNGSASLQYHAIAEDGWTEPTDMVKGGLSYLELLDLQSGTGYEIMVSYKDPDTVSGEANQLLSVYLGRACVPLALRSYAG
jgi:hypothetical protein